MHHKIHGGVLADVGNVIIDHVTARTTFEKVQRGWEFYKTIPAQPGVFEGLRSLNSAFGGNVTLVYNARDTADDLIRMWLEDQRLTERTGIPLSRVVRTTHGRDKTPFMSQQSETHYGTTVVVDDRIEVMNRFLYGLAVPQLFLFRAQYVREINQLVQSSVWSQFEANRSRWEQYIHHVDSWAEIVEALNLK